MGRECREVCALRKNKRKRVGPMTVYDMYDDVVAAFRERQSQTKDEAQRVLRQVGILDDHNQIMPVYQGIIVASEETDDKRHEVKR